MAAAQRWATGETRFRPTPRGVRRAGRKRVVLVSLEGSAAPGLPWDTGTAGISRVVAAGCGRVKPIERLVPLGCAGCPASTCGLSTWWSTTALGETWF